jgi:four helix bundle protein
MPMHFLGLTSQLRRAVTSIGLNIAEGSGCGSNKEFSRFLSNALRPKHEVIACLDISLKLGYTHNEKIKDLELKLEEISSMIIGLGRSLKKENEDFVCLLFFCNFLPPITLKIEESWFN